MAKQEVTTTQTTETQVTETTVVNDTSITIGKAKKLNNVTIETGSITVKSSSGQSSDTSITIGE
ncbi:MAG: hypothetical protein F6K53_20260 [Moorea sp. SIO4A1]|uniref:hypothetical protein n=1 Tax=Moorena sp. SIO4A1 TaxID=2607835 RepID=UPI001417CD7B|nr:hypothetical protein [Moorena sp. SIO4A1]NEO43265.1 hypothetical protein [Moorena sp. SIO4A3]NEQ59606.1 hypothetical protein [Moorena sp. SIO4A1]